MIKKTYSAVETINLGKIFSRQLKSKDVVILEGALGGGKTTFVKGIVGGFGFKKRVLSPSFTLIREYPLRHMQIYHVDLYRLRKKDIPDLGLEDYLYSPASICLIEWGDKIRGELPKYLRIRFEYSGECSRRITFSQKGYGMREFTS